jgi:UDP-N-acetylmuramate: L-alanyl-gamma-D-glutamyl-meso-diaminopimelate ligase
LIVGLQQVAKQMSKGKVHIMGVGGVAMSAVAGLFKKAGWEVRGSDQAMPYPPMGDLLTDLGISVMHPYQAENLDWGPDLVVVGNVIRRINPEAVAVVESKIPYLSFPEALREHFFHDQQSIVVAGTHGKTTTTSLIAHLLAFQGLDPSFLVGGIPVNFGINHHLGEGKYFVIEGDEYDTAFFDKGPKFLHYLPKAAIINNVEFDHADIFASLDAVLKVFTDFARIVPRKAPLLIPDSDTNAKKVVADADAKVVTFGIERGIWQARDVQWDGLGVAFNLFCKDLKVGTFSSPMIGIHNLHNVIAALAMLHELDAVTPKLALALESFKGIKKRQEIKGVVNQITVMDDFAHHPTAVRQTIEALRIAKPKAKIIVMFEIESNTSRRKVFQNEFAKAFATADQVLFCRPYEKPDNLPLEERIDMDQLCADIQSAGTNAVMIPDIDDLASAAAALAKPGDIIVGMSGRNFHNVHDKVLAKLAEG